MCGSTLQRNSVRWRCVCLDFFRHTVLYGGLKAHSFLKRKIYSDFVLWLLLCFF